MFLSFRIWGLLCLKVWEAPPSAPSRRRTQRTGKSQRERRARCPRGRWRPPPPHHHSWHCHPPRGRLPRPSLNLRLVSLYKLWATKQNYFLDRSNFSSNCWPLRLAFWSVLLPFKLWGSFSLSKRSLLDPGPERAKKEQFRWKTDMWSGPSNQHSPWICLLPAPPSKLVLAKSSCWARPAIAERTRLLRNSLEIPIWTRFVKIVCKLKTERNLLQVDLAEERHLLESYLEAKYWSAVEYDFFGERRELFEVQPRWHWLHFSPSSWQRQAQAPLHHNPQEVVSPGRRWMLL